MKNAVLNIVYLLIMPLLIILNYNQTAPIIIGLMITIILAFLFLVEAKNMNCLEMKKILQFIFKIGIILLFILILVYGSQKDVLEEEKVLNLGYYFLDIFMAILFFLLANYCLTFSESMKKSILSFINAIDDFLKENFLLNMLVFILMSLLKGEWRNSIIVSFVFYFLTEITKMYKKRNFGIQNNNYVIAFHIVINILFIFILTYVEKVILYGFFNIYIDIHDLVFNFLLYMLILVMILLFTKVILYFYKKSNKN